MTMTMTSTTGCSLDGTGIAAPPPGMALPQRRRVAGFSTRIECRLPDSELARSLSEMTERSAFRLSRLTADCSLGNGAGAGAGDGGTQIYRATFTLDAPNGATGDSQIFALLRDIAARYRWTDVEKVIA